MKYESQMQAIEATGSVQPYYDQFVNVKPELNKTYKVTGSGVVTDYIKIVAIVENVAIGKVVEDTNGGLSVGEMSMYYLNGKRMGWKYKDNRPSYRLKEIENNSK